MTDTAIVAAAVADWQQGAVIQDGEARVIASQWHGGQASALYALTSSGAITDTVEVEIEREMRALPDLEREESGLEALYGYVIRAGHRGPVDGWSRIWGRS